MKQPTEADLIALLRDPDCPRARGLKAAQAVPVLLFIRFERTRGFATSNVEAMTDQAVRALGGTREAVVDPLLWLINLVHRATGQLTMRSEDVWVLPMSSEG